MAELSSTVTAGGLGLVERGLSAAEVAQRVARGEVNDLPAAPTRTVWQIVRANVFTRFTALLGTMVALVLLVGSFQDALFGVVLVANAAVGIVQEVRAKRTLDRLAVLTAPRAKVVRDGQLREVAVRGLVLGDVVAAAIGDQIVVDGRALAVAGLQVDESLLTGESDPVEKAPGDEVLSGSFVVAGSGRYQATRVGRQAYAARLAQQARRFTLTRSELRDGTNQILKYVSWVIVPTGILLFWSQFHVQAGWRRAVSGAVAGTVAMVPEGLVLLLSIAFAAAVVRLGQGRVLVQELAAVEGLARVDVLCIDKTGTLTQGTVEVSSIQPLGATTNADVQAALAAIAANDPSPNATTHAIAARFPGPPDGWVATGAVAFSSVRKWSAMAFERQGAWVLGGPDVLLRAPGAGADPGARQAAERAADRVAAGGQRVVLLARASALADEQLPPDLAPAGLVVLSERLRPDAAATLRYFAEQDVTVKVISGDNPRTVGAIAGRLGLPGASDPVDGRELPDHDDSASGDPASLADVVEAHSVFGRVAPKQKRAMVAALQANGHTVAMTGDGVNDALALKDADIGVAMGSGSQATRAVAQLILLDSDFAALPPVVAEGRRVLGNIERTSSLYLTKTAYALVLALATGVAGFVFPFLPRHLTLVASLTIGIPSFFLALAPNAERFRPGFVPRVLRFAAPAGILAGVATLLAYELARREPGLSLVQERTTAVMTLLWVGLAVLSIIATPLTGWRVALVGAMAAAFPAVLLVPFARRFFALQAPPLIVWLAAIGIAAIVWSFARLFVPGDQPVGPRGRIVDT
jgi:cation-transporting P-type ATPase E